jgi:hypothetical protein
LTIKTSSIYELTSSRFQALLGRDFPNGTQHSNKMSRASGLSLPLWLGFETGVLGETVKDSQTSRAGQIPMVNTVRTGLTSICLCRNCKEL